MIISAFGPRPLLLGNACLFRNFPRTEFNLMKRLINAFGGASKEAFWVTRPDRAVEHALSMKL